MSALLYRIDSDCICLSVLLAWLMPQLQEDIRDLIYHQDEAIPHFHKEFKPFLDEVLHNQLTGY
jgi:hypothetical protein